MDYNGTTPLREEVVDALRPFTSIAGLGGRFGNPSSSHMYGVPASSAVAAARHQIAAAIGAGDGDESCITFTSSGSESINHVLKGSVFAARARDAAARVHIVSSAIEHPATLEALQWLRSQSLADVTLVQPGSDGAVSAAAVAAAVTGDTVLVTVMLANNETGVIQPVRAIVAAVRARERDLALREPVIIHSDAAQAVGKIPVNVRTLGVDALTIVGHKLYAPKGVSATYIAGSVARRIDSLIHGASQEGARRAGTENVAYIAALGAAAQAAVNDLSAVPTPRDVATAALRNELLAALQHEYSQLAGAGSTEPRRYPLPVVHGPLGRGDAGYNDVEGERQWAVLPNTISIAFPGAFSADVIHALSCRVAISAGAACHASAPGDPRAAHVSRVLTAAGVPPHVALCTLRISIGAFTTREDVRVAASEIVAAVMRAHALPSSDLLHAMAPVSAPATPLAALPSTQCLYLRDTYAFACDTRIVGVMKVEAGIARVIAPSHSPRHESGCDVCTLTHGPAPPGCSYALLCADGVAHPQGGGQPSDTGAILTPSAAFIVRAVRAAGPYVLHYGGLAASPDSNAAPSLLECAQMLANDTSIVAAGDEDATHDARLMGLLHAPCAMAVHAANRRLYARLHSAGHALDAAMRTVCAAVGCEALRPGKGYHFADAPFVEYEGSLPADVRDRVQAMLNEQCAAIVRTDAPTSLVVCDKADTSALRAAGVNADDVAHLPDGAAVRVVAVGSPTNVCPCGGTHVRRAGEIGGITVSKIAVKKGKTKVSYALTDAPA